MSDELVKRLRERATGIEQHHGAGSPDYMEETVALLRATADELERAEPYEGYDRGEDGC